MDFDFDKALACVVVALTLPQSFAIMRIIYYVAGVNMLFFASSFACNSTLHIPPDIHYMPSRTLRNSHGVSDFCSYRFSHAGPALAPSTF